MRPFYKWGAAAKTRKKNGPLARAVLFGVLTIARRHSSFVAIALLLAEGAGASLTLFARCSAAGC